MNGGAESTKHATPPRARKKAVFPADFAAASGNAFSVRAPFAPIA
jgi:hypothetical protein